MRKTCFDTAITVPISITIILSLLLPALAYDDSQLAFANQQAAMTENQINNNDNPANNNSSSSIVPKVVILNFYDDEKDQFINAKPILDKYGFRGTFFIVCSWTSSNNDMAGCISIVQSNPFSLAWFKSVRRLSIS
jgi:hypothetical protein